MTIAQTHAGARLPTIQDRLDAAAGHPTGFDALRIGLAVCILCFHSVYASYGIPADLALWAGPWRGVLSLFLPMFFALSGFLVCGSLERTKKLHHFFGLRAIRIVPALAVETLLCAMILGPMLTTLSLSEYFAHPDFSRYFLNIIGVIHYELPGMFENNPSPNMVNISLWTIPYELKCYLALALAAVLGLMKRRWLFLTITALVCLALPLRHELSGAPDIFWRPSGRMLVMAFVCGLLMYRFRDLLAHNGYLAGASLILAIILFMSPGWAMLGVPFAAYFTVYLGMLNIPPLPLVKNGDYSYGLYLFAFPMQQVQAQLFPAYHEWYWNAAFALVLGMAYAMFSWHCVEKPILARKKSLLAGFDGAIGWLMRPDAKAKNSASA